MNLHLETERLLLRPLADDDLDLAVAIFTDAETTKFAGGPATEADLVEEHPRTLRRGAGGAIGVWCVVDRASEEKLGSIFLLPQPSDDDDTNWDLVAGDTLPDCDIEIGYYFKRSAWGRGYATEAVRRLLRFAFEETSLPHVVATIEDGNAGSRKVLEKAGLIDEGRRRAYGDDSPWFRITRQQWLEANAPSR